MKSYRVLLALAGLVLASCGDYHPSTSSSLPPAASSETSSQGPTSSESSSQAPTSSEPSSEATSSQSSSEISSSEAKATQIDFIGEVTYHDKSVQPYFEFDFHYDSAYFSAPAADIDLGMMKFAFAMATASASQERASKVFGGAGFAELYDDSSLEAPTTADSIGYVIGSREMAGVQQIVVSVRGEDYDDEWSSNLYSAPVEPREDFNGDHYGFHTSALKVIDAVQAFVDTNKITDAKYLFTGYSRGGAVANLAAAMMVDSPIACEKDEVYAYTFESPAGMLAEHNKADYDVIHNCINENDFVTMLMPAQYGFVRAGKDINIAEGVVEYGPLFEQLGMDSVPYSEETDFSVFELVDEKGNPKTSGKDVLSFVIEILSRELTQEEIDRGCVSLHTPDQYRDNLMVGVRGLLEIFFGLGITLSMNTDLALILEALSLLTNLYADDGFGEKSSDYDPHALSDYFKKVLDTKGFLPKDESGEGDYDEAAMRTNADAVQSALRNLQLGFTKYYIDQGKEVDDARAMLSTCFLSVFMGGGLIGRHFFDTGFAVLCHYIESQQPAE